MKKLTRDFMSCQRANELTKRVLKTAEKNSWYNFCSILNHSFSFQDVWYTAKKFKNHTSSLNDNWWSSSSCDKQTKYHLHTFPLSKEPVHLFFPISSTFNPSSHFLHSFQPQGALAGHFIQFFSRPCSWWHICRHSPAPFL